MKEFLKKWWILISVILIALLVIYNLNTKEKYFNKIPLDNTNYITNTTNRSYLDTVLKVGLKELKIKGVYVLVKDITDKEANYIEDIQFKAVIRNADKQYVLFLSKMDREETILVLSHELIHFHQYYYKEVNVVGERVFWRNKEYTDIKMPYANRPWEIDAFQKQDSLYKILNNKLYK